MKTTFYALLLCIHLSEIHCSKTKTNIVRNTPYTNRQHRDNASFKQIEELTNKQIEELTNKQIEELTNKRALFIARGQGAEFGGGVILLIDVISEAMHIKTRKTRAILLCF